MKTLGERMCRAAKLLTLTDVLASEVPFDEWESSVKNVAHFRLKTTAGAFVPETKNSKQLP
jgi:hypothetical protein